jgi:hypothetical protein
MHQTAKCRSVQLQKYNSRWVISTSNTAPRIFNRQNISRSALLKEAELQPLTFQGELQIYKFANLAGVYAVYDKEQALQYVGLSRKVIEPNRTLDV